MPSFFFWKPRTLLQKSQAGLLRSILLEILSEQQDLIAEAFPEMYSEEIRCLQMRLATPVQPPSEFALKKAPNRIFDQLSIKICLFVDGLDEYSGDHAEIIQFFRSLTLRTNVKVVVSSRPLREFHGCPGLKLQDLTRGDIERFMNSELQGDRMMRNLLHKLLGKANDLITRVVDKSSGLFLWVKVVVKSLIKGLKKCGRINDLRRRVELLPVNSSKCTSTC